MINFVYYSQSSTFVTAFFISEYLKIKKQHLISIREWYKENALLCRIKNDSEHQPNSFSSYFEKSYVPESGVRRDIKLLRPVHINNDQADNEINSRQNRRRKVSLRNLFSNITVCKVNASHSFRNHLRRRYQHNKTEKKLTLPFNT